MRGLVASFAHALAGLARMIATERNARIHLAATLVAIVAGLGLGLSRGDWLWIIAAIGMVWVAEAFNTALEALCDALHPEHSEGIRRVKDVAAGAVLAAALTAALIGALVFWPHLYSETGVTNA